jgi:uncharacterized protein YkwD
MNESNLKISFGRFSIKKISLIIGLAILLVTTGFLYSGSHPTNEPVPSTIKVKTVSIGNVKNNISRPAQAVEGSMTIQSGQAAAAAMSEIPPVQNDVEKDLPLFDILSLYRPNVIKMPEGCQVITDTDIEKQLFSLINKERNRLGLDSLTWNDDLADAARKHSADMACNNFFSHTNPDGETFDDRIAAEGYEFLAAGENIYAGDEAFNTSKQAYYGWYYSSKHYRVMTYPDLTEVGIGYVYLEGSRYGGYFTADFASPK